LPKLVIAALVKNESQKFWRSALRSWSKQSDRIVVLDDSSTDDTAMMAVDAGAAVYYREGTAAWGNEAPARQQLFDIAIAETDPGDFIAVLDADMVFARDPRELCFEGNATEWSFPLFDLWSPTHYRSDSFWYGHTAPRIWLIKRPNPQDWAWPARGIHTGHLPSNYKIGKLGIAPADYGILHYGWSDQSLRDAKVKQYMSVGNQLTPNERKHVMSVQDPNPATFPLPFKPKFTLELEQAKQEAA
jgi:hypothetical protein